MYLSLSGKWKIIGNGYEIDGHVPGDITDDFVQVGLIADPYYEENYKKSLWITKADWTCEKEFFLNENPSENTRLHFDGVDTFADVFVNGTLVGEVKNMHREYDFTVGSLLKKGCNVLSVRLYNVYDKMGGADQTKYDSIFCANRIFVRKAQCHFGWDWAPKFPGYGIYRDVYLVSESAFAVKDVQVQTSLKGVATFRISFGEKFKGKTEISVLYGGKVVAREEKITDCKKFLVNLYVKEPKLWWPNGYGEQPLYEYVVRQSDESGATVSEKKGRFAFRTVALSQDALDKDNLDFALTINGRKIFCRGSNWVPAECMTGRLRDEKYRALVQAAQDANMNMLRVWGGGIYEKDCFYDYCDEAGIMIWQEFMFACSEIPEDDPSIVKELAEEAIGQVRRLRNHPSVVLWCGMNEVRGAFSALEERYSVFTLHYLFRGIVASESPSTPYVRTSPFCFADTENDQSEGDCHNNLSERCLFDVSFKGFEDFRYDPRKENKEMKERIKNYERYVVETESNFSSECAVLGMCDYESLVKFMPEEKLSLDSASLEERFFGNPYTYVMPTFFERQKLLAESMYGALIDVKDLVKKIGCSQADIMKTEILYGRVNGRSNGFLSWMFNDIWPTGTWSVVDYYLAKKPAYYEMKRCFASVLADIVRVGNEYFLCGINDGKTPIAFSGTVVCRDYFGIEVGLAESFEREIPPDASVKVKIADVKSGSLYLFASGTLGKNPFSATYDLGRYGEASFSPRFTYTVTEWEKNKCVVRIKAETFVRRIKVRAGENAEYEDNYFDMSAGEEKTVRIRSVAPSKITVCSFWDEWKK